MTSSNRWDAEAARTYEDSCAELFVAAAVDPAAGFLAVLAGEGAALEFAIGTG